MKNNIAFVWLLIKLKISRMMVFRLSFFGAFIADGMFFVMQLVTFQIIYSQVDTIGGWSRGQMLIFIGTFSMINGINMLVYFFGVLEIPWKIQSGVLDHYFTKPGSALFRLTFENVNPGSAPLLLLSGVIIAYGIQVEGAAVTAGLVVLYIILVLLMTLLWYDMEIIFRTLPFFFIAANAIERLEGNLITLNFKVPGVLYKGIFKVLFYFVFPYGIMATVPTQAITGTLTLPGLVYAVGIVGLFTWFAIWFWRLGVRNYKSASS